MKYIIQILKSKKIGLVIILVTLNISNLISQTNPWENTSKENPWIKTSEKEKSVPTAILKNDTLISANTVDSIKSVSLDSIKTNAPLNVVSQSTNESSISEERRDSYAFLQGVKYKANKDYKAPAAFVGSFFTSGIFLIIGLPVSMITSIVPTLRADAYVMNYMNQNPKASKEEVKAVRKGIQKKRSLNSLGGSLAGMATGIIVWATLIFTN